MKNKKNSNFIWVIFIVISVVSCSKSTIDKVNQNRLLGSWKVKEVHWITKDTTYSIPKAEQGIFFFTDSSYAIMWTPIDKPREPFKILSKPTDEELIAGFRSVIFNAGKYIYSDTTVISTAFIAKVPGFEGGKQFYKYKIIGNTLNLTMYDETYPDGKKPEWFGKYVTKFVLDKID